MNPNASAHSAPQAARSYWTMSRGSSDRAFQKARRHSRIVRILRVVLPALIAVTAAGITISTYLNPLLAPPPVRVDSVVVSGSKVTMDRPHMSGYTRDGRAYELKADAAVQDVTKPDLVELHNINAKVEMQDRSTVRLTAPKGDYDSKAEKLDLERNVLITSSSGYQGRLKEARVDIKTGHVVSDKPVEMKMLQGTLSANRMEIIDSGDLIQFEKGVRLTTYLNTATIKNKAANADDNGTGRSHAAASSNSDGKMTRVAQTPTRFEPLIQAVSAPNSRIWLRLPPRDPRRFRPLTTGSIR